jgi:hypothetical protein
LVQAGVFERLPAQQPLCRREWHVLPTREARGFNHWADRLLSRPIGTARAAMSKFPGVFPLKEARAAPCLLLESYRSSCDLCLKPNHRSLRTGKLQVPPRAAFLNSNMRGSPWRPLFALDPREHLLTEVEISLARPSTSCCLCRPDQPLILGILVRIPGHSCNIGETWERLHMLHHAPAHRLVW